MIYMCCVCKKIKQADDTFIIGTVPAGETISHGYCPVCAAAAFADLRRYVAEKKKTES